MTTENSQGKFPNEPIFTHLLKIASEVNHVVIHDAQNGVDATYGQLLADVLQMQQVLRQLLPASVFDSTGKLLHESTPYILVFSPGNYEFVVAGLAILSIGGAFAPLATGLLPLEMLHMLQSSGAICILASEHHLQAAQSFQQYAALQGSSVAVVPIHTSSSNPSSSWASGFEIDPTLVISPRRPSLLLYTSGTSGPPKGVVLERRLFYDMYTSFDPTEIFLSNAAPHWGSGLLSLFIAFWEEQEWR